MNTASLDLRRVRRLALAKAGLLAPALTQLPARAGRGAREQRRRAHAIVERFGYLQLDTVSIPGARSHVLVLLSRLSGFVPEIGEQLLQPGEPLFEYWGHEASWMPLELYPVFAFRRTGIRKSGWWQRSMEGQRALARQVLRRIERDGPLRSSHLEGRDHGPWWAHRPAKRVVVALWSSGELCIRERQNFQRIYDLPERVIPPGIAAQRVGRAVAIRELLCRALAGHGWASTRTLAATWRFTNLRPLIARALDELVEAGRIVSCAVPQPGGKKLSGWITPTDLELAEQLVKQPLRPDRGVLLSPFDPLLWDRKRVQLLFGFDQILEIFKPARERRYGYFCLPVLAGEQLVARVDLKAERPRGLRVHSCRYESSGDHRPASALEAEAVRTALERHCHALGRQLLGLA